MRYCKKCLMPDSRPRVVFNEQGICNACVYAEEKHDNIIDWGKRKQEFLDLVKKYKSKDGYWDCIVPWSGGKDSSTVAYKLKFLYGMNPLLVTCSPQLPTEVGNKNREELINVGFDHIFVRPDQKVHRKLSRRFFIERGNQKVAWDAGVNTIPIQVAVKFRIPLVFYAEHGETEYGGKIIHKESQKIRDFTEMIENQVGDDPRNWVDDEIKINDLNPYIYPDLDEVKKVGVKAVYFSYFFKWSSRENYEFAKKHWNFHNAPERTEGTFTDWDSIDDKSDDLYYYMQYIKFGFGRTIRDSSRQIQNRQLTREKALELVKKYDGEFPNRYLKDMLEYLSMTKEELLATIDKHRNSEIWKRTNGKWELRYPPK